MIKNHAKRLGQIQNAEQFLRFDVDDCPFDDSIKVYDYLTTNLNLPDDVKILPVEVVIESNIKTLPSIANADKDGNLSYIFWAAVSLKEQKICTIFPAFTFDDFEDFINNHTIVNVNLLERDMYFVWNNTFCAVVYTSKGEIAIRRVNGIWSEYDVRSLVGIREPDLIMPDIYPVELFSVSEHKFICAAWSVEDAENQRIFWYTIQWEDEKLLEKYDPSDLMEIPLNLNDVTQAGSLKLEVLYTKEYGKYLTKTNKPLPEHINTKKSSKKASPKQSMCIRLIPEFRETSNTVSEGKCKILTLHPSIKKDDVQ